MENSEIMEDISENEDLEADKISIDENQSISDIEKENLVEENQVNDHNFEQASLEDETNVENNKKHKVVLVVILSILLFFDVLALIIYLIGIEKVLGFIK